MLRLARFEDREAYRKLWERCFDDSKEFTDFFFADRFSPDWSAGFYEGEELLSGLHSIELPVLIRGKTVRCVMVAGVATLPEQGGKGLMRKTFTYFLEEMARRDIVFAVHTPANLPTFFSLSHLPVSRTRYIEGTAAPRKDFPQGVKIINPLGFKEELLKLYRENALRYSGIVFREERDFALKMTDYLSDAAAAAALYEGDRIAAYAVFYKGEGKIMAEEFVCSSEEQAQRLLDSLCALADGGSLRVKMPPDFNPRCEGLKSELRPQGVAGLVRPDLALRAFGLDDIRIEIEKGTPAGLNGVYGPAGREPDIKITAGGLTQLIFGYHSLDELCENGEAGVITEEASRQIALRFPKQTCFIVDEY